MDYRPLYMFSGPKRFAEVIFPWTSEATRLFVVFIFLANMPVG